MTGGWKRVVRIVSRWRHRRRFERDMADEMSFHLEMEAADIQRSGVGAREARRRARVHFGGVERFKEEGRRHGPGGTIDEWFTDLHHALRYARRHQRVTVAIASVAALGCTAFVTYASLGLAALDPLTYPQSDRLIAVDEINHRGAVRWPSYLNFTDWRAARLPSLAGIAAVGYLTSQTEEPAVGDDGGEFVPVVAASSEFFEVLGLAPHHGRVFSPEEQSPGGPAAVVVSEAFWDRRVGTPAFVGGRTVELGADHYEIVGVLPAFVRLPIRADAIVAMDRIGDLGPRIEHRLRVYGRLTPWATLDGARRELADLTDAMAARYGAETEAAGVRVRTLAADVTAGIREPLVFLGVGSGLAMLAALGTVFTAIRITIVQRAGEVRVRTAMGGSVRRVRRQVVAEMAVPVIAGSVVGVLLAWPVLHTLTGFPTLEPVIDTLTRHTYRVGAVALASAIVVASIAAIRSLGARETHATVFATLHGAQFAIACLLAVAGAVVAAGAARAFAHETNFSASHVLTVRIALPETRFPTDASIVALHQEALDRIHQLPNVESVGLVNHIPLEAFAMWGTVYEGRSGTVAKASYRVTAGKYFETLRIERLTPAYRGSRNRHVVINDALARVLWPDADPIGQTVVIGEWEGFVGGAYEVAGVVKTATRWDMADRPHAALYLPLAASPRAARHAILTVRATGDMAATADEIAFVMAEVDPSVAVRVGDLETALRETQAIPRLARVMIGSFALVAMVLACVGLYGAVSRSVRIRTREWAIRIALGATPATIRRTVGRGALGPVAFGVALAATAGIAALPRVATRFPTAQVSPTLLAALGLGVFALGGLAVYWSTRSIQRRSPGMLLREIDPNF